jgi:ABC-type antimicrobial peptide transport system permease subunit
MSLAFAGVAVGTIAATVLPRAMTSLLYGVAGSGAIISICAGVLLLMLAFVASYLPARRATRLDPVAALRPQ